jgi:hypothetical protein
MNLFGKNKIDISEPYKKIKEYKQELELLINTPIPNEERINEIKKHIAILECNITINLSKKDEKLVKTI